MDAQQRTAEEIATLTALANGIIPSDGGDGGAEEAGVGNWLARRAATPSLASLYNNGLAAAATLSRNRFGRELLQLKPDELHSLLTALAEDFPAFFRQLRADVCAVYLSDPLVWKRIGFPGPSTTQGGYPDFDQPQSKTVR